MLRQYTKPLGVVYTVGSSGGIVFHEIIVDYSFVGRSLGRTDVFLYLSFINKR